jgi:hypothetical protein
MATVLDSLIEAISLSSDMISLAQVTLGVFVSAYGTTRTRTKEADTQLSRFLKTLERHLKKDIPTDPIPFRYPRPVWADFERCIYQRREIGEIADSLDQGRIVFVRGHSGSGKSVLAQAVGYQLQDSYDYIYYESLGAPSDLLRKYHYSTEDEAGYLVYPLLYELDDLCSVLGESFRTLLILDDLERYPSTLEKLQTLDFKGLSERVHIIALEKSQYKADFLSKAMPILDEPLLDRASASLKDHSTLDCTIDLSGKALRCLSTVDELRSNHIVSMQLTANRTTSLIDEIVDWTESSFGLRFQDKQYAKQFLRHRVGPSIAMFSLMISSSVEAGADEELTQEIMQERLRARYASLEDQLAELHDLTGYHESSVRNTFRSLFRDLCWFSYHEISVPDEFIVKELCDDDNTKRISSFLLKHLSRLGEISKYSSERYVSYSLPHPATGLILLNCLYNYPLPPLTPVIDANRNAMISLEIMDYLDVELQVRLLQRLFMDASFGTFIDSDSLFASLKDRPELMSQMLGRTAIMPFMVWKHPELFNSPEVIEQILDLLNQIDDEHRIIILSNLVSSGLWCIDNRIINAVAKFILSNLKALGPFMPDRSGMILANPQIREAIIQSFRSQLSQSTDIPVFSTLERIEMFVPSLSSEIVEGLGHIIIPHVVRRIEESENGWQVLLSIPSFESILKHKDVVMAVTKKDDVPLPSRFGEQHNDVFSERMGQIFSIQPYMNNHRFVRIIPKIVKYLNPQDMAPLLCDLSVLSDDRIRRRIFTAILDSETPWKAFSALTNLSALREVAGGEAFLDQVIEQTRMALERDAYPYPMLVGLSRFESLVQEDEIEKAIANKLEEVCKVIDKSEVPIEFLFVPVALMSRLPASAMLLQVLLRRADIIASAIESTSDVEFLDYSFFLSHYPSLLKVNRILDAVALKIEKNGIGISEAFSLLTAHNSEPIPDILDLIQENPDSLAQSVCFGHSFPDQVRYVCLSLPPLLRKPEIRDAIRKIGMEGLLEEGK